MAITPAGIQELAGGILGNFLDLFTELTYKNGTADTPKTVKVLRSSLKFKMIEGETRGRDMVLKIPAKLGNETNYTPADFDYSVFYIEYEGKEWEHYEDSTDLANAMLTLTVRSMGF